MRKLWIYTAGVIPLGFFSEQLQAMLGSPLFLGATLAYVLLLRLLAEKFGRTYPDFCGRGIP
jgi:hypothetical protein